MLLIGEKGVRLSKPHLSTDFSFSNEEKMHMHNFCEAGSLYCLRQKKSLKLASDIDIFNQTLSHTDCLSEETLKKSFCNKMFYRERYKVQQLLEHQRI